MLCLQCCCVAVLLLLLRTIRSLWCFGSRDERTDHIGPNILGTLMIKIFWTIGGKRPAHASSTRGMYWERRERMRDHREM